MEETYITAIRTAASGALCVRMFSQFESQIAKVIGAGVQGRDASDAGPLVSDLKRINLCSSQFEDARRLAAQNEIASATADVDAMRESDIVCLATHPKFRSAGWNGYGPGPTLFQ